MKSILLEHETIRKLKMYSASKDITILDLIRNFAEEKYTSLISEINKNSEGLVK